ncbi:MAG: bifunctional folylpolyglutamate synthase/dihydrofolate synthase [Bacteroidota bacterium]
MNYQESLDYLLERLPMFQRIGKAAIKKDLSNTVKMLEILGNPHKQFKSIHIAGTNGKGTSAHALTSILMVAGYKTGLYTSPHLKSFTERIRINGMEVSEDFVAEFVTGYRPMIDEIQPSFFEVTVVMAFEYFRQQQVDIAIIETGLGGRLDSTNVIEPLVSLITMIGFDHMDLLGDSLDKIAFEKAGIIKPKTPVVIGNSQLDIRPVFEEVARNNGSALFVCDQYKVVSHGGNLLQTIYQVKKGENEIYGNLTTDITAQYFGLNIPGILETVEVLRHHSMTISDEDVINGFTAIKKNTRLKGRMQILGEDPIIIADISHNQPGLKTLFKQIENELKGKLFIIFGVVKDKDLASILPLLPKHAIYLWTESKVPRSMTSDELMKLANSQGMPGNAFKNVNEAIRMAKSLASKEDTILICGSTFVVAEIDDL